MERCGSFTSGSARWLIVVVFLFSSLILFFSHRIGRRDGDGGSFLWMFLCYFRFLVSHSKWLSRLSISYVKTFRLPTHDRFITQHRGLCSRVENARTAIVPANEPRGSFAACNDGCRVGMLSGGVKAQRSRSTRAAIRRDTFSQVWRQSAAGIQREEIDED